MTDMSRPGERLRRLRVGLGLGQVELADRVGLSSGSISMLENGWLDADESTIAALAEVLDCSPEYLLRPRAELLTSQPQLRAYADAPKKVVDRAVADSITAVEAAQELGLPSVPDSLPLFDGDLNDEWAIEHFATEVRIVGGLGANDVVGNAIRTAERLGCLVLPLDSELGRHLGVSLRVGNVPVIRVSRASDDPERSVPGDRQRFTVAHELGHLGLHHSAGQPSTPIDAAKAEREAHRFASSFLVPGEAALEDLDRLGGRVTLGTLATLKEKWGFAIKAFVLRFQQLGVIDDDHARSLYKQISARRWNKSEPVHVGNEAAVWLSKAVARRAGDLGVSEDSLRTESGLGRAYVERWSGWDATTHASVKPNVSLIGARPGRPTAPRPNVAPVARLPFRPSD